MYCCGWMTARRSSTMIRAVSARWICVQHAPKHRTSCCGAWVRNRSVTSSPASTFGRSSRGGIPRSNRSFWIKTSLPVSATYMCAKLYGERGFRLCESQRISDMARQRRSSDASRTSLRKRSTRAALLCGTTEPPAASSGISNIVSRSTAEPANHAEDLVAKAKSEAFAKADGQLASAAIAKVEPCIRRRKMPAKLAAQAVALDARPRSAWPPIRIRPERRRSDAAECLSRRSSSNLAAGSNFKQ